MSSWSETVGALMSGLAIDRAGAWTPLGGLLQAAAAWRAGLSRAVRVGPGMPGDADRGDVAHLAPLVGGAEGFGRLHRMSELALEDAGEAPSRREPVIVLVGSQPTAFLEPDEALARLGASVARWAEPRVASRASFVELLAEVDQRLSAGTPAVWVVALDTELSAARLDEAERAGRLRTDQQPAGYFPGEAAVVLRFVRAAPGQASRGVLRAWSTAPAALVATSGGVAHPLALAGVVGHVLGGRAAPAHVHADLDGSEPKARAWGRCLVALRPQLEGSRTWIPALGFGEPGVVSTPLSVALALGRRLSGDTLVTAIHEHAVGAIYVEKGPIPCS